MTWDEVEQCAVAGDAELLVFDHSDLVERVERDGDLFGPVLTLTQELPSF